MCKNAALGHRRLPSWLPMLLILLVHPNFDSRAQQEDPAGAGTSISPTLVPTTAAPAQQPTTDLPQIFPQQQQQQLVLRACCGGNCEEFQRPEEMYGIMCCGDEPSNQFEEICCGNVPRRRRQPSSFIDRCCGNQTLAYDQTCCNGVVHNIPSAECCGRMAYPRNSFNTLCCEENLLTNVEPSLTCCGKNGYDGGKREICCGGQVHLKEMFDGCCAIYGKDPAEYQPFSTRTQQCCDRPIERFGSTKCCYLKDKQGHFYPSSYDASSQCCAFPFTTVTPRNSNGTCIGGG